MSDDIEAAARRAERRIKAVSLQHHAHEDSAVLLHALLVDVPAAIEEEFMALRSALLARLARVEEALRFYADEGTYCLSHPAHGGYECCGGGDEGPIIEDRGSKARAALAKNAGNTPPTATGEAPPCGCDIDATRHDRSCPAYTGNAAPTPPPATGEAGTRGEVFGPACRMCGGSKAAPRDVDALRPGSNVLSEYTIPCPAAFHAPTAGQCGDVEKPVAWAALTHEGEPATYHASREDAVRCWPHAKVTPLYARPVQAQDVAEKDDHVALLLRALSEAADGLSRANRPALARRARAVLGHVERGTPLPEARDGKADPRRGEDGAAIDAQDPMAEYVAASLAWWLDESEAAEHLEGETWERFHAAYYRLPVDVRRGRSEARHRHGDRHPRVDRGNRGAV